MPTNEETAVPAKVHHLRPKALPKWLSPDLIEALPVGVYVCDAEGILVAYNQRASLLWGREPTCGDTQERFCGAHRLYLSDGQYVPHAETPMATVLRNHKQSGEFEAMVGRPDGTQIPVLASVSPLFSDAGEFIGFVNCVQDMSSTKTLEAREAASRERVRVALEDKVAIEAALAKLQASEEHRQLLAHELQHRVRNTLSVVQSLVVQTLRNATDPDLAAKLVSARLNSLGRAYDILANEHWKNAPLQPLVEAALAVHPVDADRLEIDGPKVQLTGSEVIGLSFVLHELATNAIKYGALSTSEGQLRITWRIASDTLCFTWQEIGGPAVVPPTRRGFGSTLIERALGGPDRQTTISYLPEGVCWTLNAPLGKFATVSYET
jgi:PAS domain S-box-containing protein